MDSVPVEESIDVDFTRFNDETKCRNPTAYRFLAMAQPTDTSYMNKFQYHYLIKFEIIIDTTRGKREKNCH